MILSTLNGIAVMLAHTPDAAMSIPEQIMIQPPLSAILAKPAIVSKVASNAPYVALVVGFAMWGGRVAQLRQGSRAVPMPDPMAMENGTTPADVSLNGTESMPDTGPIWDELQSIRVS